MKILLRHYGEEEYVWKKATWNTSGYVLENDSVSWPESSIVAIQEDERSKYVRCQNCGEIIANTPDAIEAHYKSREANKNCLTCSEVKESRSEIISTKYNRQEDGTYKATREYTVQLYCGPYWNTAPIMTTRSDAICKYTACRRRGVSSIEDVFVKYPGVFDTQLTVDAIVAANWAYDGVEYVDTNECFFYDGKLRNTMKAVVNKSGIVEWFFVKCKGASYYMTYSAKYDKFFYVDYYNQWGKNTGNTYKEGQPSCMTDLKYEQVCKKIKQLYQEASINE